MTRSLLLEWGIVEEQDVLASDLGSVSEDVAVLIDTQPHSGVAAIPTSIPLWAARRESDEGLRRASRVDLDP